MTTSSARPGFGPSLFIAAMLIGAHTASLAQSSFSEGNKTVSRLGAQSTFFYVDFAEPFGQNCLNGVAYVANDRKGLYTQLLAAKLTGRRIKRIDYSQEATGQCNVELVELTD